MTGYSLRLVNLSRLSPQEAEEAARIPDRPEKFSLPYARVVIVVRQNHVKQRELYEELLEEIRRAYNVRSRLATIVDYEQEPAEEGKKALLSIVSIVPSLILVLRQPIESQDMVLVIPGIWNSVLFLQLLAPLAAPQLRKCYQKYLLEVNV
jgi:hypothetical protein